ncbi:MAG TPA: RNA polymerase sigma factor [Candidatus Limnocylindria bacterium]|nr:RNA polymerase sigma factor [Candidatus Limnocylindria bacterium]
MDRELLLQARAGDREAFELVVVAKAEPLLRTALAILGNEADARDAVQETFVNAWRGFSGLRDPERFDAWLGRILINQCRMALRHRGRVREIPMPDSADSVYQRPASETSASTSDFDVAFNRLSADQRSLLVMHHLHGYDVREIGQWLGIPSGTVKWRLSRARKALAAELER